MLLFLLFVAAVLVCLFVVVSCGFVLDRGWRRAQHQCQPTCRIKNRRQLVALVVAVVVAHSLLLLLMLLSSPTGDLLSRLTATTPTPIRLVWSKAKCLLCPFVIYALECRFFDSYKAYPFDFDSHSSNQLIDWLDLFNWVTYSLIFDGNISFMRDNTIIRRSREQKDQQRKND